jgi:hypothetical protein
VTWTSHTSATRLSKWTATFREFQSFFQSHLGSFSSAYSPLHSALLQVQQATDWISGQNAWVALEMKNVQSKVGEISNVVKLRSVQYKIGIHQIWIFFSSWCQVVKSWLWIPVPVIMNHGINYYIPSPAALAAWTFLAAIFFARFAYCNDDGSLSRCGVKNEEKERESRWSLYLEWGDVNRRSLTIKSYLLEMVIAQIDSNQRNTWEKL